jgi:hypothetical protein
MSQLEPDIDDEMLVTFLDGELPPEEANKLRLRIMADNDLKQRVDSLRASWELLDELPVPIPNLQLAQTTIELIAQGMAKSPRERTSDLFKKYRWLALGVASLLAIGAGWSISRWQANQITQSVVAELVVLTNFRNLDNIDSQAWLEKLATIENLEKAGLPLYVASDFPALPASRKQFKAWVDGLNTNQKLSLQAAYRSFVSADPVEQQTLRSIAGEITKSQSSKSDSLIKAYAGLLQSISQTEAFQIKAEEDLNKRAEQIQNVVRRELAIGYANHLSDDERSRIIDWCDDLKLSNSYFLNSDDPDAEIVRLLDVEAVNSNIQSDDIEDLINCVQTEGRELLQSLDLSLQTKVLKLWVYNSLPSALPKPQYTSEELLERFQKLPLQAQNELIYAPGNEVIKTLSQDASATDSSATD